jgi:cellulose synthase/poly-beta-1,6-N-acetylglucosamine synthase-like glycosyltransferase
LLEIQVLDDSTDETTALVANQVARLRRQGVNIHHLHRDVRTGYKAGALAYGLPLARGEFIAIFDADFVPYPDFLRRTIPHFAGPQIAFVQARWGHINRDYSLLTYLQSLAIDAHFMVEQFARFQAGMWFNFNGTAGVWRKAAMLDAGGWQADTLTEDLDLSYRAFLRGWRAVYLRDVEVPAELPVSFSAYRRQQHRWARGSMECAIKYIPLVWKSDLPLAHKIEASLHLTGYCVHLLLAALVLLYPLVLMVSGKYPAIIALFGIGAFFNLTALAPTIFFLVAEQQLGNRWWQNTPLLLFISVLGAGMMLNTLQAALGIVMNKSRVFERTPKFGIVQRQQKWLNRRYQLKLERIIWLELVFAIFNAATVALAIHQRNWLIALYAAMFSCGLLFTSGTTILQAVALIRQPDRQPAQQESAQT